MLLNDLSSPLALLLSRRTAKARDMVAPGPDATQLERILTAAVRVPDHGKLAPWRFVVVDEQDRPAFEAALLAAYRAGKADAGRLELEAVSQFARQAPCLVIAISSPRAHATVPVWEQELSMGAACQNLLVAAHASGFAGCWLTGWAAYAAAVNELLGLAVSERIAGFLFLGSPGQPIEERPRPELERIVSRWSPAR